MTLPGISTKSDVIVALNLATDALATARQLAMPGAAEAAGALILGAFEGASADIIFDARLGKPIAYARGAAAWLVTEGIDVPWGLELHRRCDRLATVVDTIRAGFGPAAALPIPRRSRGHRVRPPGGLRTPAERGTSKEAAAILGIKPRKLQVMSQAGQIPGAAKLRRQWTYDLAKLRRFVKQREQACQNEKPRAAATGAVVSFGGALRSVGGSYAGRLRRMIQDSQKRAAKRAKRER